METPKEKVKALKNNCPKCGNTLFAFWLTPNGNETGLWYVVCMNAKCRYENGEKYSNLEMMLKRYDI